MADIAITPYSDVSQSKKKIDNLKEVSNPNSKQLMDSMTQLTQSMHGMLDLFKTAADEMKLEEREENALSQQMSPILAKLDEIIDQNKVVADGMVALADLIKERIPKKETPSPFDSPAQVAPPPQAPQAPPMQPTPPPMQAPPMAPQMAPPPVAPMPPPAPPMDAMPDLPEMPPPPAGLDVPPPPEPKKHGLFRK